MRSVSVRGNHSEARLQSLGALPPFQRYLAEAWSMRELAVRMAWYDYRALNQDYFLGRAWNLLSPLLRIGVYAFVFGLLLAAGRPADFLAFLAVGLFTFDLLQSIVQRGGGALDDAQLLLSTLYFPRLLLPFAVAVRSLLEFRTNALVMVTVVIFDAGEIRLRGLLELLLVILLGGGFAIGLAFVVAWSVTYVRDVRQVLPVVFRLAFYVSGVLFPIDAYLAGNPLERLLVLNPFYVFIALVRHALLVPVDAVGDLWTAASVWCAAALLVGTVLMWLREHVHVRL